jgi:hypothetical protein
LSGEGRRKKNFSVRKGTAQIRYRFCEDERKSWFEDRWQSFVFRLAVRREWIWRHSEDGRKEERRNKKDRNRFERKSLSVFGKGVDERTGSQ